MALLDGRTAFITGAAQGLGEAIARALRAEGANVVLTDIDERVHATAAAIGGSARLLDVRDEAAFRDAFAAAAASSGGIDIMVNNAARTPSTSIWDIAQAEWDDVMAVNLRGQFFGCRIAGAHMRERGQDGRGTGGRGTGGRGTGGRIINLSSLAGQQGGAVAGAHYAASKAGILVLTKMFAQELAPFGITVNALAPAAVRGPAVDAAPADKVAAVKRQIPVGRLGEPEEVGAAAVYLAAAHSGYMTGAVLDLNGGRFMR
jgi:3-oxoacyl-[acyl-carrier protein] reductase